MGVTPTEVTSVGQVAGGGWALGPQDGVGLFTSRTLARWVSGWPTACLAVGVAFGFFLPWADQGTWR